MKLLRPPGRYHNLLKICLVFVATSPFLFIRLCGSQVTAKCGGVAVCMGLLWAFELAPLSVTALFPVIAFPFLGIMSGGQVSRLYMNDTLMIVFGSSLFGAAIQAYHLHKFIALFILSRIGVQAKSLLLAFMCVAGLLSMWLTNTATAVLLMPMATATMAMLEQAQLPPEFDPRDSEVLIESQNPVEEEAIFSDPAPDVTALTDSSVYQNLSPLNVTRGESQFPGVTVTKENQPARKDYLNFCKALVIAIGYSCTWGGTATTVGTGTNLAFLGIYSNLYPNGPAITFTRWLLFGLPFATSLIVGTWVLLIIQFIGIGRSAQDPFRHFCRTADFFQKQADLFGPLDRNQKLVMFNFVLLIVLWVTRDFGFAPGWASWFKRPDYITDGTVCITLAFLFFIFPKQPPSSSSASSPLSSSTSSSSKKTAVQMATNPTGPSGYNPFAEGKVSKKNNPDNPLYQSLAEDMYADEEADRAGEFVAVETPEISRSFVEKTDGSGLPKENDADRPDRAMLGKEVINDAPWGTLLLLGGAFALAAGCESSGLTLCIADSLEFLDYVPFVIVLIFLVTMASMLSEFTSNVATNTILQPIIKAIAVQIKVNPLALMIPVTMACSCSTMLPISTPPNSISYGTGYFTTWEMMKAGAWVKLFALSLLVVSFLSLGLVAFDITLTLPDWAKPSNTTTLN
eukprot:gb/GEZN01003064.1/.p1 GENE.gb/GEZN01003064.1/~~gb/GEZN01003064.1/.p1  ORF type:complete len:684 (+),score=80.20 gb/GEZN01003064.1/:117-2168(+)